MKNKYDNLKAHEVYYNWKEKQKMKNTLSHYIKLYGDMGYEKWFSKNNKISMSNSNIDKDDVESFERYIRNVDKFTRISLSLNNIENLHLRGQK